MPRSPPEEEAALGRCPWDGAAGEAHTGVAGSWLDAGTLSTALSPRPVVPEPPQTQSLQQGCEVEAHQEQPSSQH